MILKNATPDNKIIARFLHLPQDMNKLLLKHNAHLVKENMAGYKMDNRTINDRWDQICKDTVLYAYVKQHESKRDVKGAFYAINSM